MTACVECLDVEACEDCEMGTCEFCCTDQTCPRSYANPNREEECPDRNCNGTLSLPSIHRNFVWCLRCGIIVYWK